MAPLSGNRGFTLLEVMMGLGIASLLAVASGGILVHQARVSRHVEERLAVNELRTAILEFVDCKATHAAVCMGAMPPRIYSARRTLNIVGARYAGEPVDGRVARETVLRIGCKQNRVTVEYRHERDGKAALDPLTGQREQFQGLFTGPLCADWRKQTKRPSCAKGTYLTSLDFDTGRFKCERL